MKNIVDVTHIARIFISKIGKTEQRNCMLSDLKSFYLIQKSFSHQLSLSPVSLSCRIYYFA